MRRFQDAKNKFYRKLNLDKETREALKYFNKIRNRLLKNLGKGGKSGRKK